ncbi:MAG: hypothetical protein AAFU65_15230, partial [Pseudomonadota bacterium]
ADVVREFDLGTAQFVEGGFSLPEAKNHVGWKDIDHLYVATDFGPGSMTSSSYPRIVKEWRGGTPLANAVISGTVFEAALGWLLGYANDAVRMQQTSWMAYYNANWLYGTSGRPALPRYMINIVGTDVETAFWDPDSYCGGYTLNVGLEFTQNWLNSCSDGFIDCSSQAGAGNASIYDGSFTNEPLSHNQSRRQCFGIDVLLRNRL